MHKVFLLVAGLTAFFFGQAQVDRGVKFDHLTTSNGLSNNQVNSILQDEQGFIWIGTLSGLNKYDGYQVKTFYHETGNEHSILNNSVIWMSEGPDDKIWINTGEGISLYDQKLEMFFPADAYTEILQTEDVFILGLQKDGNGDSWFRIQDRGLVKFSTASDEVLLANSSPDADIRISSNTIHDITRDKDGNIWVIHGQGIIDVIDVNANRVIKKFGLPDSFFTDNNFAFFVDSEKDVWVYTTDDPKGLYYLNTTTGETRFFSNGNLSGKVIRDIDQDNEGMIWIGVDHGGIVLINKKTWKISGIRNDPDHPSSLISNNINELFIDKRGIVWVGTTKSGLSYFNQGSNNFYHYKYPAKDPSFNDMSSVVEDKYGNLWIGTNGQGLQYFDTRTRKFLQGKTYRDAVATIDSEVIVNLLYSSKNELWAGTYLEGLKRYGKNVSASYRPVPGSDSSISSNSVWYLYEDSKTNIWIGTLNSGLDLYNPAAGTFTNYASMNNGLNANYVTCITEDREGNLWVGTGSGLSVINPSTGEAVSYLSSDTVRHAISNNSITSLLCDSQGIMWVGTMGGLNVYDSLLGGFRIYKESDGLSSDIIMAILEDNHQNLWMSTSKGITRATGSADGLRFQAFDASDGLQGDSFSENAAAKTSDGKLIFMGQNGFNLFDPKEIRVNRDKPDLAFTGFYVSNTRIQPGREFNGRKVLQKNLNYTDKIELEHDENSFAVEFVALTFFQSRKNNYQYKLEGFDEDWMDVSPDIRMANYTNLDYGTYRFQVRASNNHNVWNEAGVGFDIVIHPPFWETPLAFFIYTVLAVAILYFTRKLIIVRERSKARIENERLEAQRQHELDLMKIKFFTNVSHEFRTPISLVLSPIESMIKNPDNIKVSDFKIIQRNAKRLLTLVNQLLDFRKMEANQHVLSQSNGDLIKFLRDIIESFSDLSRENDIQLVFESDLKEYFTLFDKDKMEKIMFNLLSNAFKFTMPDGKIIVDLEKRALEGEMNQIVITVSDTGIGMPPEKLPYIFNRFFQTESSGNIINNGTGIGLSITKEFVELHNGKISVESTPGIGSSFTIELPLKDISQEFIHYMNEEENRVDNSDINGSVATGDKHEYTVALVEDNADFRFYLKDNLKQHFNVLESSNGKDGWKAILEALPDVVISDIMMPGMNGLELCRKIKGDPRTACVPVILLTAQASDQHKIEGLEAGAIEYISKPFNFEILISTINSALRFQKRVNEARKVEVKTSEISIVSVDEQLVNKAVKLVEDNMANSDFSVEDMSHELGYSRGHFYQKMIKITGQTPMDFIRNIRMKRAAELLKKSQLTVSEIAYKVGYNNPKLFSRYFKSQYKMYPSEYMHKHKEADKPVS